MVTSYNMVAVGPAENTTESRKKRSGGPTHVCAVVTRVEYQTVNDLAQPKMLRYTGNGQRLCCLKIDDRPMTGAGAERTAGFRQLLFPLQ